MAQCHRNAPYGYDPYGNALQTTARDTDFNFGDSALIDVKSLNGHF
jgi:hypothetical protein